MNISKISTKEIRSQLTISNVLKHYGGECTNQSSGAWWCIMHESGGKASGHKTPSLVAKDERGTATCMSRQCFQADDIFSVIAKMDNLDIKSDFAEIKKRACDIAGISYSSDAKKEKSNNKKSLPVESLKKKHIDYLRNIGISKATADKFDLKSRYDYILYPQKDNGKIKGYKGISITKDKATGKSKQFFEEYTAPLFHKANPIKKKTIIFTEGEKDCMSLTESIAQAGAEDKFMAVTITTGAKTVPSSIVSLLKALDPIDIFIIYDHDAAGAEGAHKLAKEITTEFQSATLYKFPEDSVSGYDISDFFDEGNSLKALFTLEREVIKKEVRTLHSSYPRYVLSENAVLDTLTPEKILYTGYEAIDSQCPIIQGENTIIVGRTGKGKTVLGVNFVNKILENNEDTKIIVFSLELKKKAFLQRLLAAQFDVEMWKIKKGFISNTNETYIYQKDRYIENANNYIKSYKDRLLVIDDIHSIDQIEKILDDLKSNLDYGPSYILIDYANILSMTNLIDISKHIQISTWMKFLAKERNIHVQAICQANRATRENDDGYARTENLADSDQYGRDAFIVYSIKTSMETDVYSINPTKNRNGKPEEEISLRWNPKSGMIIACNEEKSENYRV